MVTTDTAQTITAGKTFENYVTCFGNKFRIRQPSSGSGANARPTVSLRNANDEEVGFLQYHPTNNQIVYGADERNSPGIQVALRQYATSNAYSALVPTTTDKYSNIGSGDVTLPLGIKVGSTGTVLKANNGGLVQLPEYPTSLPVEVLTTAPSEDYAGPGMKIVYLSAEPATKYSGYIYMIAES